MLRYPCFFEIIPERAGKTISRTKGCTAALQHAPASGTIHGGRDSMVPVTTAQVFARALKETSQAPVAYAELNQAQHAFDVFPSLRTNLAVRAMATFAENVRLADGPVAPPQ